MLYPMVRNRSNLQTLLRIPDDIFRAIQAAYIKTYMVNQTYFSELAKIVTVFAAEDIDVLLLKGGDLAPFVYGDIGVRWMNDIDILIKRKNFNKAHDQLSKMGYQYPDMGLAVWDDFGRRKELGDKEAVIEWYETDHMHLNYFSPDGIQNLELHFSSSHLVTPQLCDKSRLSGPIGGTPTSGCGVQNGKQGSPFPSQTSHQDPNEPIHSLDHWSLYRD